MEYSNRASSCAVEVSGGQSSRISLLPGFRDDIYTSCDRLRSMLVSAHLPTAEHSVRVRICSAAIAAACRFTRQQFTTISIAAEIHDIGKLEIPVEILNKTGRLTSEERTIVETHAAIGYDYALAAFPKMPEIAQIVVLHHERLDGSGYPYHLTGNDIPLIARIVAVADVFCALTENRPFRDAYTDQQALEIMASETGKYDQRIITLLERMTRHERIV